MEGLGGIKFERQEFLDWNEMELKHKIESLSNILTSYVKTNRSKLQYAGLDYIGANYWNANIENIQPYSVPHWSLGLEHYDRRLRLFIQCEGTKLSGKIAQMDKNTRELLVRALLNLEGDPHFQLRVEEKWFIMQKGSKGIKSIYPIYFTRSMGNCENEDIVRDIVNESLQAINRINATSNRRRVKDIEYLEQYHSKTIVGVLQLSFSLNWFELENINDKVEDYLKVASMKMMDYYSVLSKYSYSDIVKQSD
jgi:hypothetical protein